MRKETMKAFEHRREEVLQERQTKMQERQQSSSKMRTLGASNPHNNNKDRHRGSGANTRVTGDTVGQIFGGSGGPPNGGVDNVAFEKYVYFPINNVLSIYMSRVVYLNDHNFPYYEK